MSEKSKIGRPTKLNETIKTIAINLYKKGMTDKQVSELCGITEATINNWKKKEPDFFASIKEAKKNVDEEVEKKLLERCLGYDFDSEEIKVLSDGKFSGSHIERVPITKHVPPDITAIKFWLINRKPKDWREKQVVEHQGTLDIAETMKKARERAQET